MDWQILTVITAFIGMVAAIWKIARDFRDDLQKTTDLLFKRFDAHKEATDKKLFYLAEVNDKKYAQQTICDLTRSAFAKTVDDMKTQFTKNTDEINRKLDLLLEERRKG